jgi:hypothetical protein
MPLCSFSAETMDEYQSPLGMIGRNVNRRKPHKRVCRNTHFMTIKVQIDVHEKSLHELELDVNFGKRGGDAIIVLTFFASAITLRIASIFLLPINGCGKPTNFRPCAVTRQRRAVDVHPLRETYKVCASGSALHPA